MKFLHMKLYPFWMIIYFIIDILAYNLVLASPLTVCCITVHYSTAHYICNASEQSIINFEWNTMDLQAGVWCTASWLIMHQPRLPFSYSVQQNIYHHPITLPTLLKCIHFIPWSVVHHLGYQLFDWMSYLSLWGVGGPHSRGSTWSAKCWRSSNSTWYSVLFWTFYFNNYFLHVDLFSISRMKYHDIYSISLWTYLNLFLTLSNPSTGFLIFFFTILNFLA